MVNNEDIEYPRDEEFIKRIRYERWCRRCRKNTLGPPINVSQSKFGKIDPEALKSTMEQYECNECHTRYRIPKKP